VMVNKIARMARIAWLQEKQLVEFSEILARKSVLTGAGEGGSQAQNQLGRGVWLKVGANFPPGAHSLWTRILQTEMA
jgi:hypothetical protein